MDKKFSAIKNYYYMFFRPIVACSLYEHATQIIHGKLNYMRMSSYENTAKSRFNELMFDLPLFIGYLFVTNPESFSRISYSTVNQIVQDHEFFPSRYSVYAFPRTMNSIPFLFRTADDAHTFGGSRDTFYVIPDNDPVNYWELQYDKIKSLLQDQPETEKLWRILNVYTEGYTSTFLHIPYYVYLYSFCLELEPYKDYTYLSYVNKSPV